MSRALIGFSLLRMCKRCVVSASAIRLFVRCCLFLRAVMASAWACLSLDAFELAADLMACACVIVFCGSDLLFMIGVRSLITFSEFCFS